MKKIYDKFTKKDEPKQKKEPQPKIDENKGDKIIELLHKENKKSESRQETDKYKYVKDIYNDLL